MSDRKIVKTRGFRWSLVAFLCVLGVVGAWMVLGWEGWAQSWIGDCFQAASGGTLGWLFSRYVLGLNLSDLPPEQRPMAAISQALLVGLFACAVAF